jgi:hypothetical protein
MNFLGIYGYVILGLLGLLAMGPFIVLGISFLFRLLILSIVLLVSLPFHKKMHTAH